MRKNLISQLISLILCFAIVWVPLAQAQTPPNQNFQVSQSSILKALEDAGMKLESFQPNKNGDPMIIKLSDSVGQTGTITVEFTPSADGISPPKANMKLKSDGEEASAEMTDTLIRLSQLFKSTASPEVVNVETKKIVQPFIKTLFKNAKGAGGKIARKFVNIASFLSLATLVATVGFSAWNIIEQASGGNEHVLFLIAQDVYTNSYPAALYVGISMFEEYLGITPWIKVLPNMNVRQLISQIAKAPQKILQIIIQGLQNSKNKITEREARKNSAFTPILKCEDMFQLTAEAGAPQ